MALWWIGNLVLLLVVLPAVIVLLARVLQPVREIQKTTEALRQRSNSLVSLLDAVNDLPTTRQLVRDTSVRVGRYGEALDEIL